MIIHPSTIRTMEVCPDCRDVVGLFHRQDGPVAHGPLVQRGTCPLHKPRAFDPRWSGFDFNRHVDLCRCCGRIPLRSGSRWSVWFCLDCKEQVGLLNGRHGRCIVPIGRHSVHYGYTLRADELDDPVAVEAFLSTTKAMGAVIGAVSDWYHEAVGRNLEAVEPGIVEPMPVEEYCREVALSVGPRDRFREMCAYLDRRGRAMLEEKKAVDG